jgi:hypothetical protein
MAGPDFQPDDPRAAESESEAKVPAESPDASVLESVVRQTLASDAEPLSADTMEALRDVARRYAGQPFGLEPQGVELVATLIGDRLLGREISHDVLNEVSRDVATSLSEAPEVWQRVEQLWQKLGETSS